MDFSNILKALRKEYGLTAKTLSKQLNLSINIIYDWEHGRCEPSYNTLTKIADIFSVSTDYLLGREDDFGHIEIKKESNGNVELSEREQRLLALFDQVSIFAQDGILFQLEALAEKEKEKTKK